MPGGRFRTADPVEPGWTRKNWYKAYNAAHSRIRNAEGQEAATAARASGRTRKEAIARKSLYDSNSKKRCKSSALFSPRKRRAPTSSHSSPPTSFAENKPVESPNTHDLNHREALAIDTLLNNLPVESLLPATIQERRNQAHNSATTIFCTLPPLTTPNPLYILAEAALSPLNTSLVSPAGNNRETYPRSSRSYGTLSDPVHPSTNLQLLLVAAIGMTAITLSSTYPLTPSQAEQVVAIHEEETLKINEGLESIRSVCVEKCQSNTKECVEHSKEVRALWRKYYTTMRSGSWASYRSPEYIFEMRRLFDSKVDIQKIHDRAAKEIRLHYKDALCTVRLNEDPAVKKYKQEEAAMFDRNAPESEIRDFIRKKELEVKEQRSSKQLEYDSRLGACKNDEERRAIYQEDACTPLDGDTQAMTKLRLKWKGLFEGGMPYPDIYAVMQKDVTDHVRIERELKEKLDGLQRAKAAHDKEEIAKEAKKAAKEIAAINRMFSRYTFYCTTEGCQNLSVPISQDEGNLQCGICNQLADSGIRRGRSFFCSEECMERDGRSHLLKAHSCAAAAACTTGVFNRSIHEKCYGVCMDCWQFFGVESYFCSNECVTMNWAEHCSHRHVQLRANLVEKLENNKEFFDEWKKKMRLTEEEVRRVMTGGSFGIDSGRLAIRTSASPS